MKALVAVGVCVVWVIHVVLFIPAMLAGIIWSAIMNLFVLGMRFNEAYWDSRKKKKRERHDRTLH